MGFSKTVPIEGGQSCPKCQWPMQRYRHSSEWTPKPKQPYFFAFWDVCRPCSHMQHYESAKTTLEKLDELAL